MNPEPILPQHWLPWSSLVLTYALLWLGCLVAGGLVWLLARKRRRRP